MKTEKQRTEELLTYLKEAKEKNWAIDTGDLCERYDLSLTTVRECITLVFG